MFLCNFCPRCRRDTDTVLPVDGVLFDQCSVCGDGK